ncbi:hypothetical protein GGI15_004294 [Coemansia interrupta]|uniref:Cap-specific mRNA (nucleoside-2'-O-)-methyltransferase 1 n=1 Tax=Coemansia interrupta TaxID=1126814 RepID=A0A9W8H4I8_9FUNG|nr:hypothetical protein GGI15_004294 [Coemansia interrupta]
MSALYTDDDTDYNNTKLESGVYPPTLATIPLPVMFLVIGPDGENIGLITPEERLQMPDQPRGRFQKNNTQRQGNGGQFTLDETIDTIGKVYMVVSNTNGPAFAETQLVSSDWLRMMSDQESADGRRSSEMLANLGQLQTIHTCKEAMLKKNIPPEKFTETAQWLNPYAGLSHNFFVSVSAVALGNIDFNLRTVSEYMGQNKLRFVDLGSSRGGFSEYILWRASLCHRDARGWFFGSDGNVNVGDKLNRQCRAAERLDEFHQTPGSGGILNTANIDAFVSHVKRSSSGDGIDLVVAEVDNIEPSDLGLGHEKLQYSYSMAQSIIALRLLRRGGTFVFKVHELSTKLSAELLFLVHACFERVAIFRSLASRPTSAERFIVCNHLFTDPTRVADHLYAALTKVNSRGFKLSHLVSWTKLSTEHGQFLETMYRFSNMIAPKQAQSLQAVANHIQQNKFTRTSPTRRQSEVAIACFTNWQIPVVYSRNGLFIVNNNGNNK